jgi:hypothetical protein
MAPGAFAELQASSFKLALPERPEPGKPLGRHVHHDPRSWEHPADRAPQIASVRHAANGLPLIQGESHKCSTAHALCGAVNAAGGDPSDGRLLTEADAVRIYETASAIEGYDLEGVPVPGSSALLACKAARRLGLIRSYGHAFGIDHALEALTLRPVMTGIPWYTSFDLPDPATGLVEIAPGAVVRGGHELLADEIDVDREVVWLWSSWGPDYGVGGRCCMTFDTWARLLEADGDVTVPVV